MYSNFNIIFYLKFHKAPDQYVHSKGKIDSGQINSDYNKQLLYLLNINSDLGIMLPNPHVLYFITHAS